MEGSRKESHCQLNETEAELETIAQGVADVMEDLDALSRRMDLVPSFRVLLTERGHRSTSECMRLLSHMHSEAILELVPAIFGLVNLSHHRHQAVELLNTLPNKALREVLAQVVFQRLRNPEKDFDYFSWQWTAAMFEDLGLDDEAERVRLLALAESDPDIKEFLPFIIGAGS